MDNSQRRAVCSALNQKVSVVTGPPGTGKTQMIVNLIANALLFGKKVLVASKNNKAVDNVKELAKTEHSHPLGMVVSTHFRCGKGVKRGLKNGALPFKID